jgi:hypothetical protein
VYVVYSICRRGKVYIQVTSIVGAHWNQNYLIKSYFINSVDALTLRVSLIPVINFESVFLILIC